MKSFLTTLTATAGNLAYIGLGMLRRHQTNIVKGVLMVGLVTLLGTDAMAQVTGGTAFGSVSNTSGLAGGLSDVVRWVYLVMKVIAVISGAYGVWQMKEGDTSKGIWAVVAALALFFWPAIVDLAQKIGSSSTGSA